MSLLHIFRIRHLGIESSGMEAVDVDWGRLEFEVSQVDLVLHSPIYSQGRKKKGSDASTSGAVSVQKRLAARGSSEAGQRAGEDGWKQGLQTMWNQVQEFVQDRIKGELKSE